MGIFTSKEFGHAPHNKEWERFDVIFNDDGTFSLKTHHGTYMSASKDDPKLWQASHNDSWEHWTMERNPDGTVTLRSWNNMFVSPFGVRNSLARLLPSNTESEIIRYTMVTLPGGKVAFLNRVTHRYLSAMDREMDPEDIEDVWN